MLLMETLSACPLCASTDLRRLLTVPDYESLTGDYGIDECVRCGVAFTNPRPLESELPKLYEQRSTADFPRMGGFVQGLRDYAIDRYLASQLGDCPASGKQDFRVLDFGCGDGALSRGLLRLGRARGCEMNVTAVDFHEAAPPALATVGCNVAYQSHATWHVAPGRHDAIFLRHVLEHHPQPLRLLNELGTKLRSQGRLFIEIPNRRSVWARVFGASFFPYYVPRHLFHFDLASIRRTLALANFSSVDAQLAHTPVLGRSLSYLIGRDISNTGVPGLATYPLQVTADVLARTSTTLRVIASTHA